MADGKNAAVEATLGNAESVGGGNGGGASQATTSSTADAGQALTTIATSVSSSKKVTSGGAKVTTVANGGHHSASNEPERVTIKADPATALGISFAVGGIVRQVAPNGQVVALGVREGWRLADIGKNDLKVTATTTPKCILAALATARKKGKPYTLGFSIGRAEEPRTKVQDEEKIRCGAGDGNSVDDAGDEAAGVAANAGVVVSGGETVNVDRGGGEDKSLEQGQKSALAGEAQGEDSEAGKREEKEVERAPEGEDVPNDEAAASRGDGEVTLMYEMYDEKFAIKNGCVSSAAIDETYCLSFVMPDCTLHLGPLSPTDRYAQESNGASVPYLQENPPGTFHGLVDGGMYWVYVSRDDEEERRDRERTRQIYFEVYALEGPRKNVQLCSRSEWRWGIRDVPRQGNGEYRAMYPSKTPTE